MSEDNRRFILPLSLIVGVASIGWLLSAFVGDVQGMLEDRDARFWIIGTMIGAVIVAHASRRFAIAAALVSLSLILTQRFGPADVDVSTLRAAAAMQLLFVGGLVFDRRAERTSIDY